MSVILNGLVPGELGPEGFAPHAIVMIDDVGRITMVNAQAERMFGYHRIELLGKPVEMLSPDRFRAHYHDLRASIFDDLRARFVDAEQNLSGLRKSGAEFPVEIVLELVESGAETQPVILATILDITDRERKMAETGYLAAILDASKDAIISQNLAGIITSWNSAATDLFGYAADEVIGRHISLIVPHDRLKEEESMMTRVRGGQCCEDPETLRRHKDGSELVVARTIFPIFGPDGKVIGSSKTIRDITALKAAEGGLRESAGRISDLANSNLALETRIVEWTHQRDLAWRNSRDLQLIVDSQGVFQAANDAWTPLLGWLPEEVAGRHYLEFIHPDDQPAAKSALGVAAVGVLPVYEDRYRHKDGTYHWVSWVASPVGD